jgi:putative (di)nucleoside polyphosphate hydrolase
LDSQVIDSAGYRANVAMVIVNRHGKIFWGRRVRQQSWQFPQGGINVGETPLAAMYRELYEEVGLRPYDVEVIAVTRNWLRYRIPKHLIRATKPTCIGQKQKWFLVRLVSEDAAINLQANEKPEFGSWKWVNYWHPVSQVVNFKRQVYRAALNRFKRFVRQRGNNRSRR